jgi:hypothetical protein
VNLDRLGIRALQRITRLEDLLENAMRDHEHLSIFDMPFIFDDMLGFDVPACQRTQQPSASRAEHRPFNAPQWQRPGDRPPITGQSPAPK